MNKVTQSIYKKKVDDLENDVKELQENPTPHCYVITLNGKGLASVTFYVHTLQEIALTGSNMFDYILEATKIHNNHVYSLMTAGVYQVTDASSADYGVWSVDSLGAYQNYPGESVTGLKIKATKTGTPGASKIISISKNDFISIANNIIKLY